MNIVNEQGKRDQPLALVIGGGGFLGRALVRALLDRGWRVRTLSRKQYPELVTWGIDCRYGDIRGKMTVKEVTKGVDCVFHVAAHAAFWGLQQTFYEINVEGTKNVIEACQQTGVRQLIYTSSPSVVFPMESICGVDESIPYPSCYTAFYPQTKALAEQAVLAANSEMLATCALRPHIIWGPGDRHLLPMIIERARKGRLIQIGDGTNLVDTCYIDNAVHAHLLAQQFIKIGTEGAGKAFFITDGTPVNLWEWIRQFLDTLGLPPIRKKISTRTGLIIAKINETLCRWMPFLGEPLLTQFMVANLAYSHYFSIESARKWLHYTPIVTREEGFRRTIEAFQKTLGVPTPQ